MNNTTATIPESLLGKWSLKETRSDGHSSGITPIMKDYGGPTFSLENENTLRVEWEHGAVEYFLFKHGSEQYGADQFPTKRIGEHSFQVTRRTGRDHIWSIKNGILEQVILVPSQRTYFYERDPVK